MTKIEEIRGIPAGVSGDVQIVFAINRRPHVQVDAVLLELVT